MADGDPELDELELDPPQDPEAIEEPAEPETPDQPEVPEEPETPVLQTTPQETVDRQPSRSESRIRALREENQRKDQELADFRRRLDELSQRVTQPTPPSESPEQRAARFALMSPQEAMQETLRESEQRHAAQMTMFQRQLADTADRTAFQAKAASDPLYAKWAPKVEAELASLRTKGVNLEREVLMFYQIGKAAVERRMSKEGKQETQQAQRRVQQARTRPTNSGSDTQPQRRQSSTVERRLENVNI